MFIVQRWNFVVDIFSSEPGREATTAGQREGSVWADPAGEGGGHSSSPLQSSAHRAGCRPIRPPAAHGAAQPGPEAEGGTAGCGGAAACGDPAGPPGGGEHAERNRR